MLHSRMIPSISAVAPSDSHVLSARRFLGRNARQHDAAASGSAMTRCAIVQQATGDFNTLIVLHLQYMHPKLFLERCMTSWVFGHGIPGDKIGQGGVTQTYAQINIFRCLDMFVRVPSSKNVIHQFSRLFYIKRLRSTTHCRLNTLVIEHSLSCRINPLSVCRYTIGMFPASLEGCTHVRPCSSEEP